MRTMRWTGSSWLPTNLAPRIFKPKGQTDLDAIVAVSVIGPIGLPIEEAFWSLTLFDKANGLFIPNEHKKYSVGENAGMKLNEESGIEIYVSAKKPEGVQMENWLPINRKDEDLDIILRVYVPELEKLSSWKVPVAEVL